MHEKHKKMKISIEELYKGEHYGNIVTLLWHFQDEEGGLQQKHFRHALIDNESEQLSHTVTVAMERFFETPMLSHLDRLSYTVGMERFFETPLLSYLYETTGSIQKGCIATQKDLNYYLNYLLQNNVIEKVNRKKPFRYKLNKEYGCEVIKWSTGLCITEWRKDYLFHGGSFFEYYAPSNDKGIGEWFIFGLPLKMDELFDKNEIKQIATCLKNVEENLRKIVEMKCKKTIEISEKMKKQKNHDIPPLYSDISKMDIGRIDFFYSTITF